MSCRRRCIFSSRLSTAPISTWFVGSRRQQSCSLSAGCQRAMPVRRSTHGSRRPLRAALFNPISARRSSKPSITRASRSIFDCSSSRRATGRPITARASSPPRLKQRSTGSSTPYRNRTSTGRSWSARRSVIWRPRGTGSRRLSSSTCSRSTPRRCRTSGCDSHPTLRRPTSFRPSCGPGSSSTSMPTSPSETGSARRLLDFFHGQFREVVVRRWLAPSGNALHVRLATYFAGLDTWLRTGATTVPNRRKLAELPFHYAHARQWDAADAFLTDRDVLRALVEGLGPGELVEDLDRILEPWGFPT